jgi:DNA-binding GntR family transcriptional regulator
MNDDRAAWEEQRQQAVAGHGAALDAARAREAAEAAALLTDFVARAAERGLTGPSCGAGI